MKKKLWILLALAVLPAVLFCSAALADYSDYCGLNVIWEFDSATGVMTISGSGEMYAFASEENVPWYNFRESITSVNIGSGVTNISMRAFSRCTGLTGVTIPASVTSVGFWAFRYCSNLTGVTILNPGCTIGDPDYDVFIGCASGFTLRGFPGSTAETYAANTVNPCSFQSLGSLSGSCGSNVSYSFDPATGTMTISGSGPMEDYIGLDSKPWHSYREAITSVRFSGRVTRIGDAVFSGCTGLNTVPIPDSVTSIGNYAFNDCAGLTGIIIPNSVTRIGCGTFQGCSGLTSVTLPGSVTEISFTVFRNCTGLTSAAVLNPNCVIGNSNYNVFMGCAPGFTLRGFPGSTAEDYAANTVNPCSFESLGSRFGSCGDNVSYSFDFAAGTLSIRGSGEMTSFSSLGEVPWFNFREGITSVNIGSGVTSISKRAFYRCTGLTGVTIPATVTSVGFWAFRYCANLAGVTVINPGCAIGDEDYDVFMDCASGFTLYGWSGSTAEAYAANGKNPCSFESLGSLSGSCGENVTYSFDHVTGTMTISGTGPMKDYIGLGSKPWHGYREVIKSVSISDGVTRIGDGAFSGCTGLYTAPIPDSVTSIGNYAFNECTGLTVIIIPNSVTRIGTGTFLGCSGLTSVTLPGSVAEISFNVFRDCSGLTSAAVLNPDCVIGDSHYDVFKGCAPGFTLYGLAGSTAEAYAANPQNPCSFDLLARAPDFFLPAALTSIEADAFEGISAKAVLIPKNIRSITGNPFAGSGVQYIYGFPGTAAETLARNYTTQFVFLPLTDAWYARLTN